MAKNIKYPVSDYPSLEPTEFFRAFPGFPKEDYARAIGCPVDTVYCWLSAPGTNKHRNPTGPAKRHTATIAKDLISKGCKAQIDLSNCLCNAQK